MNSNEIFRRVQVALELSESDIVAIFAAADEVVTATQVGQWLRTNDDPQWSAVPSLAAFLDGLINHRRGRKDGPAPAREINLTNNRVFMKLRIAMDLSADGILEIFGLAGLELSRHELSALFRRPDNKHYRACDDMILAGFLDGLQTKLRSAGA